MKPHQKKQNNLGSHDSFPCAASPVHLHTGQLFFSTSHFSMQSTWYSWLQSSMPIFSSSL
ncbi:hypothetical protein Hanom_Chr06g00540321 [Helianthus anomalus]